jgi:hypothetical protein
MRLLEGFLSARRTYATGALQPVGQEEFFTLVGQPVATRTQALPPLDAAARAAFIAKSKALTPQYRTELFPPPGAK